MKANSSTARNKIKYNNDIKTLKAEIAHLKKELDNTQAKAELYNEMINIT